MNPTEYQRLASRTECDQTRSLARMANLLMADTREATNGQLMAIRTNHAVLGMMGEVGELAGAIERWLYYGKGDLDLTNIKEEAGDVCWYIALLCNATGLDFADVMEANIQKLKVRYPSHYTDWHAAEENRDRAKEGEALEGKASPHK